MCLAIPAQISQLLDEPSKLAIVDILGVRRKVSLELLADDQPQSGDWVLIHVGFAMSKISARQANEQLQMLTELGEAAAAQEEAAGYQFDSQVPDTFFRQGH
jgi:hydrogenase expression/formation protein HypC